MAHTRDAFWKYLPDHPEECGSTAATRADEDKDIPIPHCVNLFKASRARNPIWEYIATVDTSAVDAHVRVEEDGSLVSTYILPDYANHDSTMRDWNGAASTIGRVHVMTQKVLSEDNVVVRLTTCTCDVFGMLVSLRKLPSASKPILCSHCVLVNVIEDSLDSPAERESYLTAYPALAG